MTRLILTILFLLAAGNAFALTLGTGNRGASFSTTNSLTFSSPTVSGNNVLGMVLIGYFYSSAPTISGVTWNGVNMTLVPGATNTNLGTAVAIYYIVNPASGSTNVVVSASSGDWTGLFAEAIFWTGANEQSPIDSSTTNTGAAASTFSGSLTTNHGNEYVVDTVVQTVSGVPNTTGSTTFIKNGNNGNQDWGCGYHGNNAAAGSVAMTWSSTLSGRWLEGSVSIRSNPGLNRLFK